MRAWLASPLGFLIGVSLGALGGGGSILAVPALVYGAGQQARAATTTSLLVVGLTALVGLFAHWRAGRVRAGPGFVFGLVGIGGSVLGSRLNQAADPDVLLLAFSGLMMVAVWPMLRQSRPAPAVTPFVPTAGSAVPTGGLRTRGMQVEGGVVMRVILAGTLVGFLTGFFGVGGGFVIVPALVLALRFPMDEAVGTSLLVIAINTAVALSQRLGTSAIEWAVAVPFGIAAVAGVGVGSRLTDRVPARSLTRWFVILLIGVAGYTATRSVLALVG
ncbi:MAG: sulfite exporter TauE/SafE family protein [Acidimicrobiales bacterium]